MDILNAEIQALTSNSPIPVASVDDMTDTTKIYVLTSTGKWYYYNTDTSTWTIGGDYQAAQSTDDVAGLIYNEFKRDLKYLLDWEVGSITSSGTDSASTDRIRTRNILRFGYDVYMPYTSNVRGYIYYYDENDQFTSYLSYPLNPTKPLYVPAGQGFRMYLDYDTVPEGGRPVITDPYASYLFSDFAMMSYDNYVKSQLDVYAGKGIVADPANLKFSMKWMIGDTSNAAHGVPYQTYQNNRRMINVDIIKAEKDLYIPPTTAYSVGLWTYSNLDGDDYTWNSWLNLSNGYTIPKGTYFRLLLATVPNSSNAIIYNLYDNNIFIPFEIYDKVEEKELQFIDYDLNVKAVNHRGYNDIAPENTLPAYKLSSQYGYTYVECDVRFTSDNVPVLIHDRDISRTSNGTGNIDQMTYAQASQYDFGSWKSAAYAGTTIPTLGEFLNLCRSLCLIPYIEIKHDGVTFTQEQMNIILKTVKDYGMKDKATYLIDNSAILAMLASVDDTSRVGYLTGSITASHITYADMYKADREIFFDARLSDLNADQIALAENAGYGVEVWTVDSEASIIAMDKYISGVTSNNLIAGKVLYNAYMGA